MQLELFNALKTQIQTISALKKVALWNNQFDREDVHVAINYPNCFIEFANIEYTDMLNGIQSYEMDVNLHLGFKSFETEDTTILTLKQTLHNKVHMFSDAGAPYCTHLLRRSETQNFDHDDVQEYIITYRVSGRDFSINDLPATEAEVDTLTTTVDPVITNTFIKTASPEIP